MKLGAARRLLKTFGVRECNERFGWLVSRCPLAQWRHEGGRDGKPSFGISLDESRQTYWNCFGCSDRPQPIETLLHSWWLYTGKYPWKAAHIVLDEDPPIEFGDHRFVRDSYRSKWEKPMNLKIEKFPPEFLDRFPSLLALDMDERSIKIVDYLVMRGIARSVIDEFGVRFDAHVRTPTMIFPLTNEAGVIQVLRARTLAKSLYTINGRVLGYPKLVLPTINSTGCWFGRHRVNPFQPVIIVEGEIDAMRLVTLGKSNVVASCTANVSQSQVNTLDIHSIILGYDNDMAGRRATRYALRKFFSRSRWISEVNWGVAGRKDAGEIANSDELALVMSTTIHHRSLRS